MTHAIDIKELSKLLEKNKPVTLLGGLQRDAEVFMRFYFFTELDPNSSNDLAKSRFQNCQRS